jgi:hypothetical protein
MEVPGSNGLQQCNDCNRFPDCPVKSIMADKNGEPLQVVDIEHHIHYTVGNEGNSHQKTHSSDNGRTKRTTTLTSLTAAARVECVDPKKGTGFSNTIYEQIDTPYTVLEATVPLYQEKKRVLLTAAGHSLRYTFDAEREKNIGINQLEIDVTAEGESRPEVIHIANISDIHLGPGWMRHFGFNTLSNLEAKLQAIRTGLEKLGASNANTLLVEGGDFVMRKDKMWALLGMNTQTSLDVVEKGIQIWNKVFGGFQMIKVTGNADVQHAKSEQIYEQILDPKSGMKGMIPGFGEPWKLNEENMLLDYPNAPVRVIRTHDYYHQPGLVETTPEIVAKSIWDAKKEGKKVIIIATHFAKYMEHLEQYQLPDDMVIIMTSGHTHDLNYRSPKKARDMNQRRLTDNPNHPWIYGCYKTEKSNIVTVSGGVGVSGATPFSNSNRSVDLITVKY